MRTLQVLAVLVLATGPARATSGIDRHELPPRITPIKQKGKVAGFKLTLRLQPVSYDRVRIGLGKLKSGIARTGSDWDTKLRLLAAGEHQAAGEPPYLLHQFAELTGLAKGQPKEVQLKVLYKDTTLKPGDKVDVVSAWTGGTAFKMNLGGQQHDYWHVFGMYDGPVNQNDESSVVTLP